MDARHWEGLRDHFAEGASVVWPNTGERFDVDAFVSVNREYPGKWSIRVEKLLDAGEAVVSVVRVTDGGESFHAVSFFEFAPGTEKIARLEEYWGSDGPPPAHRNPRQPSEKAPS